MNNAPIIQVLSRTNYENQHIVALPKVSFPALAPSSVRVQTTILSLTTNNLTYARVGHLLGWWDIHPLPACIPSDFSDSRKFGRISCWGYGTVIETTVPEVVVGAQIWGYLPIGTLPVDLEIDLKLGVPGQFVEVSKHRAHVLPVYNRYLFYPPTISQNSIKESQGYDSLLQVLFETGYMMNRFVFPWDSTEAVYPFGDGKDGWTFEKGVVDSNTIFLLFAASGKTGLSLAYALKNCRPESKIPRGVFAVGSTASKAFATGTGLFDKVLLYDAYDSDLESELGLTSSTKIIVCDFGARAGAADVWAEKLRKSYNVVQVGIGREVIADTPEEATAKIIGSAKYSAGLKFNLNASGLRSQAMELLGEKEYFRGFFNEWNKLKEDGGIKGLRLVWGEGMVDVGKGWDKLCRGEVSPDEGLVFSLDVSGAEV